MRDDGQIKKRNVIPRWRPVARSVAMGETDYAGSLVRVAPVSDKALIEALELSQAEFNEKTGIAFAAETVSTAILAGRPSEGRAAARRVMDAPLLSPGLKSLSAACLRENPLRQLSKSPVSLDGEFIGAFRSRLRSGQFVGAYNWLDLALAYTSNGQYGKASRALSVARSLMITPTRLLIRAETRFFQHTGKMEEALHLLRRERDMVLSDPWLLATEIGLSRLTKTRPTNLKKAIKTLGGDFSPLDLSELAAAVGTEELMSGSHRRARNLFRQAIKEPAEQGLAQTVWATEIDKRIEVPPKKMFFLSAEARAREALTTYKWKSVASASEEWLNEEPFSTIPAIVLSGTLSINLGQDNKALEVVQRSLGTNPGNISLLNNQAYILARLGRLKEATTIIKQIVPEITNKPDKAPIVIATGGLIFLRGGQIEEGQQWYRQAYGLAKMLDKRTGGDLATRVAMFYMVEASFSGSVDPDKDEAMIKAADPEKLKGNLKETYLTLKKHYKPQKPNHREAVVDFLQGLVSRFS